MDPILFGKQGTPRRRRLQNYLRSIPGLVAYYPLDEASGNAINRCPTTFGTLDGTISGVTQNQPGLIGGKAYSFDGVNDLVQIGYTNIFDNADFSVGMLFKTPAANAGTNRAFFGIGDSAATDRYVHGLIRLTDKLSFAFWGDDFDNVVTVTTDVWHAVVFTFNATTKQRIVYYDNTAFTNTSAGVPDINNGNVSGSGFQIGKFTSSFFWFPGLMSNFFMMNQIMTAAQVTQFTHLAGLI